MSDEELNEQKEAALFQHGEKVAKEARHAIHGPVVGEEKYVDRDVMGAMFYMHQQTVAAIASEFVEHQEEFDDEDLNKITEILNTVRGSFTKTQKENE